MSDLNDRQARALTALLGGKTITDAARAAGVNEKTVRRWLTDSDEFNMALAAGGREALLGAMNITTAVARNAAGVVIEVMRDPRTPPGVRLRAATAMLEMLLKWAELQDFEVRLRKLEGKNDATE
jgi:hypothetical protein